MLSSTFWYSAGYCTYWHLQFPKWKLSRKFSVVVQRFTDIYRYLSLSDRYYIICLIITASANNRVRRFHHTKSILKPSYPFFYYLNLSIVIGWSFFIISISLFAFCSILKGCYSLGQFVYIYLFFFTSLLVPGLGTGSDGHFLGRNAS